MSGMSLIATAVAGEVVIDARVPAEIEVERQKWATLLRPGVVRFSASPGTLAMVVYVDGDPQPVAVTVPATGAATVLIGRSGVTGGVDVKVGAAAADAVVGPAAVEVRNSGARPVMVRVDGVAYTIDPRSPLSWSMPAGIYRFEVRDVAGRAVWARGRLQVGGGPVVVQVSEGRFPEVSGDRSTFTPDGG
jgi:hypothetical protein